MSQGDLADYVYLSNYLGSEGWLSAVSAFVRPGNTTAYTAPTSTATGDLIANSATAGSVAPLVFDIPPIDPASTVARGEISYVALAKTGAAAASVRLHLFKGTAAQAPTVSGGDNAALAVSNYAEARYLGYADVALQPGPGGGASGFNDLVRIPYQLDLGAGEKVWALPEALTIFTPANAGTISARIAARRRK